MNREHLEFHTLTQIAYGTKRHGYGIAASLNQRLGTNLKAKQLYPVLDIFEQSGLTKVLHSKECHAGAGKFEHAITEKGRVRLQELEAALKVGMAQLEKSIQLARRSLKVNDGGKQNNPS